jgi:Protein of unknown function (DUF2384)
VFSLGGIFGIGAAFLVGGLLLRWIDAGLFDGLPLLRELAPCRRSAAGDPPPRGHPTPHYLSFRTSSSPVITARRLTERPHPALGYRTPMEVLTTNAAAALEPLVGSAPPLIAQFKVL